MLELGEMVLSSRGDWKSDMGVRRECVNIEKIEKQKRKQGRKREKRAEGGNRLADIYNMRLRAFLGVTRRAQAKPKL